MDEVRNWSPIVEKLNKKDRLTYLDQVISRFKTDKFKAIVNLDERIKNTVLRSLYHLRNDLSTPQGPASFLKIKEAADYLGISQQTMRNWHHNCKLVPNLISEGGYRYYSLKQLNLFKRSSKKYRGEALIKKSQIRVFFKKY